MDTLNPESPLPPNPALNPSSGISNYPLEINRYWVKFTVGEPLWVLLHSRNGDIEFFALDSSQREITIPASKVIKDLIGLGLPPHVIESELLFGVPNGRILNDGNPPLQGTDLSAIVRELLLPYRKYPTSIRVVNPPAISAPDDDIARSSSGRPFRTFFNNFFSVLKDKRTSWFGDYGTDKNFASEKVIPYPVITNIDSIFTDYNFHKEYACAKKIAYLTDRVGAFQPVDDFGEPRAAEALEKLAVLGMILAFFAVMAFLLPKNLVWVVAPLGLISISSFMRGLFKFN